MRFLNVTAYLALWESYLNGKPYVWKDDRLKDYLDYVAIEQYRNEGRKTEDLVYEELKKLADDMGYKLRREVSIKAELPLTYVEPFKPDDELAHEFIVKELRPIVTSDKGPKYFFDILSERYNKLKIEMGIVDPAMHSSGELTSNFTFLRGGYLVTDIVYLAGSIDMLLETDSKIYLIEVKRKINYRRAIQAHKQASLYAKMLKQYDEYAYKPIRIIIAGHYKKYEGPLLVYVFYNNEFIDEPTRGIDYDLMRLTTFTTILRKSP